MDWKKLITIKHLRTLNAISEAGSLAIAAEILNLSPPAVTIQLNQIEEILNVRILERGPNGFIKISNVWNFIDLASKCEQINGYNIYFAEYPFGNQWSIFPMIDLNYYW